MGFLNFPVFSLLLTQKPLIFNVDSSSWPLHNRYVHCRNLQRNRFKRNFHLSMVVLQVQTCRLRNYSGILHIITFRSRLCWTVVFVIGICSNQFYVTAGARYEVPFPVFGFICYHPFQILAFHVLFVWRSFGQRNFECNFCPINMRIYHKIPLIELTCLVVFD